MLRKFKDVELLSNLGMDGHGIPYLVRALRSHVLIDLSLSEELNNVDS